jgi:hypothetical protein
MAIKFSNNARTLIASSVASTDTTITVEDASVFPTLAEGDVLYLTIANVANNVTEIVKCTSITDNTLTVTRGVEDTTPRNWTTDDNVSSRLTTELLETITSREYLGLETNDDVTFNSVTLGGGDTGEGKLVWNNTDNTVDIEYNGVTLQVGQEQHFYGKAVGNIADGEVVMFAGAQGDHLLMTKADASVDGFREEWVIGVATQDFVNNEYGYVTTFGAVRNLDTSAFSEGDLLYFDVTTAGALTNVEPAKPNHTVLVAAATRIHSTEGTIFVRPSFRSMLNELHNVDVDDATNNDVIAYNSTSGNWENTKDLGLNTVSLTPADNVTHTEGKMYYNSEYKALTVFSDISDISLQVGLEDWIRVYNNTGSVIGIGTPVYSLGSMGEALSVAPANATSEAASQVMGIATHDIAVGGYGFITERGLVSGIDTSQLTAGERVHLSPTGALQVAAPTYPYFPVDIGTCVVSDNTNGYLYVNIIEHTMEQFRVTGNTHFGGNLTVEGDLVVQGTQTITNEANLSISDSFIYLNSGDTIGDAGTTFSGTGLNDAYFTGHYKGTTTITYYVRIDGVGTGTGGVDTFEWSKDNFSTTEATGVDLTTAGVALDNNIKILFNAATGHTLGDSWSGTAAPVNVDSGWFTNYNTGTEGVGYTHAGVFLDTSDSSKFKFIKEYSPEPSGNINLEDESVVLGTIVAASFEGLATDSARLNNELPSYYLNYNNFTNTPTIGNGSITVTGSNGLSGTGTFALNDTSNSTVTLSNSDKGSSQNIFKSISVSGQTSVNADSNNQDVELVAGDNVTITTDDTSKQITIASSDTDTNDYLTGLSFADGTLTASVQNQTDVTVSLDGRYLRDSGDTITGNLNFGDNVKATFGADSDLQIYHNGSSSRIEDSGTGNLEIRGDNVLIRSYTGGEAFIRGFTNAQVDLFYNAAVKLATTNTGIDVTGTITSDGLTVDGISKSVANEVTANSATTTIDMTASNFHVVNMSTNTTFSLSNLSSAITSSGTIIIKQDGTGGRNFTLPSVCKTPVGGASIVQSTGANTTSILTYLVVSSTEVLVNYIGNYA